MTHGDSFKIIDIYKKLEVNQKNISEIIKHPAEIDDRKPMVDLKTKEGRIFTFYEDEFSFAEKFLGEDVEYSIAFDESIPGPACLVKSNKGNGFILGRGEK